MIRYRPFLNSDPPAIAAIWRSQPPSSALAQPMSAAQFDETVCAKPYFDREGLLVAEMDGRPIGFAHAGFGVNERRDGLATQAGAVALLLVEPHASRDEVARELLVRSEQYLRQRGAQTLYGGATASLAPFYHGLYGGSRLPGVLSSDAATATLFRQAGYAEAVFCQILRRSLTGFRPPVDRQLMQLRRQHQIELRDDPLPRDWWEGCAVAAIDRALFCVASKSGEPVVAASFWNIEPAASGWGVHAMGLLDWQLPAGDPVLATFFLGEVLRQLQSRGTTLVEIQVNADQAVLGEACRKLDFQVFDQGWLFSKAVESDRP